MKPIVSVYIATSLDGYIARTDGGLDWLDAAQTTVTPGEDCGYAEFTSTVDILVMGRTTYEKVLSFGAWPYGDRRVIVLSSSPLDISESISQTVSHSSETPQDLCDRLAQQNVKRIYIDGGITIQRFLSAGLVDDMTITYIPILLGAGIPLFGPLTDDIQLEHVATETYDFGFVQVSYNVTNA